MKTPSQSNPWIGRLIGERQRYRLDKRLATGGMGEVFLAMDTLLGKPVALKLLKHTLVASAELRKRFEREVALCAALKSDHIVEVNDYGVTAEGYPFFVMKYLRGQSLGQLLRQQQRLPLERTVNLIAQVCDGLQLAHTGVTIWRDNATVSEQIKVVHRDLKPDNIFIVPTALGELVKILDFGVAKIRASQAENTSVTNMFLGTFHYAAPEQLEVEKDLDERADIYSLGMIIYEMLSGTDPFGLGFNVNHLSINDMLWALAHTSKLPLPLRAQPGLSQLSPELEAVVMRCLQKAPDERFGSVDELKQALQAAIPNTFQRNLEQIKRIIAPIEPHLAETHNPDPTILDVIEPHLAETHNPNPTILDVAQEPSLNQTIPIKETRIGENKKKTWQLLLQTTAVVAAIVGLGLAYYYYYTKGRADQAQKVVLENIELLKEGKNYQECVNRAKAVLPKSPFYTDAQNLLNYCQRLAQDQDNNLLAQAEERYKQALNSRDLENAINLTKAIPKTSPVAKNAEEMSKNWRIEWKDNENYLQAAQNALKQGKWQEAINETDKVRLLGQKVKQDTPYWQHKMKPIIEMAQKRIAGSEMRGGNGTNNALGAKLPAPQPIPSPVPYLVRPPVQAQPQHTTPYLARPPVQPRPQQPAPYLARPPVQPRPQQPAPYLARPPVQPRPQQPAPYLARPSVQPQSIPLSPEAHRILCQQFPLNSRCGGKR